MNDLTIQLPDEALEILNELSETLDPDKNESGIKLLALFVSRKFWMSAGKTTTTLIINPGVTDVPQVLRMVKALCEKKLSEFEKRK